jgi:hypothetical protein
MKMIEQIRNKLITNLGVSKGFQAVKFCCEKFESI